MIFKKIVLICSLIFFYVAPSSASTCKNFLESAESKEVNFDEREILIKTHLLFSPIFYKILELSVERDRIEKYLEDLSVAEIEGLAQEMYGKMEAHLSAAESSGVFSVYKSLNKTDVVEAFEDALFAIKKARKFPLRIEVEGGRNRIQLGWSKHAVPVSAAALIVTYMAYPEAMSTRVAVVASFLSGGFTFLTNLAGSLHNGPRLKEVNSIGVLLDFMESRGESSYFVSGTEHQGMKGYTNFHPFIVDRFYDGDVIGSEVKVYVSGKDGEGKVYVNAPTPVVIPKAED